MTCDPIRQKLDTWVDASCPPEELAEVEEHLEACPACASLALHRLQLKRATRAAAARYTPSAELRLRIQKSIQPRRKPFFKLQWNPAFALTAAVLLLAVASAGLFARHQEQRQVIAELLDLHVATMASANPVDVISTDRHTVKPWFQGKLPFTFNLPELQDSPFKLVGGKLVYFHHAPGAQLLFELRKHQLSVFIVTESQTFALPGVAQTALREQGFSIESWSQNSLRYVVVGDTGPAEVHQLAGLLRSAAL